ncbi:MAG: hypothetical protein UY26_C0003G0100 [Candidatus Jorgensenbacteria bacterium GW2011_GWA1_48_13]|uniref:DUF5671 domain-containing protein n=1 Tax=Candidatus Jorgensenbacteria bacterium GW2011_GWB1_50_10 TaxID=1618665 RepID=A0A0G1Z7V2_9BACT|nr:MAG: hypothetical protein UY26_C0003G0100 [Candidatus Jorgensenbacteria bacterium GW2011_GWA1_48_13]KKW15059.1 MAG: hypothetical protein UY55_C0002G0117 [Candidatus Jorgensenbacteria bacterium GW2011_GWB1_50_10]
MNPRITAKDFFLHIGTITLLYVGTVALLNLLFRVINVAFPQVNQYGYYSGPISLPVATLIVVFPLFLFLASILRRSYKEDPSRKEYPVRKWLIYISLFAAGAVLAGDLVTVIYYFLDGRELTTGFVLKILAVFVVIGGIFGYFTDDLKDRLTGGRRNFWRIAAAVLVLGSIVAGFTVIGSPRTQRLLRYDSQKISDLQAIQWQVVNYWQQKETLPPSLAALENPLQGSVVPTDPETKEPYEYRIKDISNRVFELCATFALSSRELVERGLSGMDGEVSKPYPAYPAGNGFDDSPYFKHEAGRQCFERTIDPDLFPPFEKRL